MTRDGVRSSEERHGLARSGPIRVLVVDDFEANLVAMEALLGEMGCEVVLATSGNEALRQLLKFEFAVLLLDVQMPEMDGYEVARYARQHPATREVPIIFLTATSNTEDNVLRGYGSGAVDFLFKPLNPAILRSKVRVFLELYAGRRQLAEAKDALERRHVELQKANAELEAAYVALKNAQAQLIQSAKMASLGELVAGVAHEINNPLAFVMSHLDTVRKSLSEALPGIEPHWAAGDVALWSRAQERLQEMGLGLDRIRDLVAKLRTFSRLDEGEWKTVSMRECVDSVLTILRHRLADRIAVETHLDERDSVHCIPSLMNQALLNLCANGIDAIAGDGKIEVASSWTDDSYVISVTDSGIGIPDELRDRVIEPFFTTKPVGQGTGLGLSITYSIVQRHGGTLELRRGERGGTVATIVIPQHSGGRN